MIIDQLPNLSAVQAADEIPVERGTTTYKATLQKLKDLVFSNLSYAQAQDINALTSLNGTFTAPDYGFIFGQIVKDENLSESQYELKVGNKIVVRYQTGTTDVFYSSFCIPIAKGDTITVSRCSNIYFSNSLYLPKFIAI